MSEFVKCGKCGTVYDMRGTHGTTCIRGYCPMCGLHHSGTHSIAYPVLKPSPLAAKPIDSAEIMVEHYVNYVLDDITKRDVDRVSEKLRALGWEEVVRCRDCKYYKDHNFGSKLDWCRHFHYDVRLDGFCAWGERKE